MCGSNIDSNEYSLHHFNGNHTDNSIQNLMLVSRRENDTEFSHSMLHHRFRTIDVVCPEYLSTLEKGKAIEVFSSIATRKLCEVKLNEI